MDNDVTTSMRVSAHDVLVLATCAGFGLNCGWYALDSATYLVARLALWWHG